MLHPSTKLPEFGLVVFCTILLDKLTAQRFQELLSFNPEVIFKRASFLDQEFNLKKKMIKMQSYDISGPVQPEMLPWVRTKLQPGTRNFAVT